MVTDLWHKSDKSDIHCLNFGSWYLTTIGRITKPIPIQRSWMYPLHLVQILGTSVQWCVATLQGVVGCTIHR